MKNFLQKIALGVALIGLLCFEHTLGLPVLSFAGMCWLILGIDQRYRIFPMLLCGSVLAAVYGLSFALSIALFFMCITLFERHPVGVIQQRLSFFGVILLANIGIAVAIHRPFSLWEVVFHVASFALLFVLNYAFIYYQSAPKFFRLKIHS